MVFGILFRDRCQFWLYQDLAMITVIAKSSQFWGAARSEVRRMAFEAVALLEGCRCLAGG
jgi:hypothetical protein